MKRILFICCYLNIISFQLDVKIEKVYQLYFSEETYKIFQSALKSVEDQDHEKSLKLLNEVIENSYTKLNNNMPIELNPYYYRCYTHYNLGNYLKSIEDYTQVINDTLSNEEVYNSVAENYRMLGNYSKAIEYCDIVINELNQNSPIVFYVRGMSYLSLEDTGKACLDFQASKNAGLIDSAFIPYTDFCEL